MKPCSVAGLPSHILVNKTAIHGLKYLGLGGLRFSFVSLPTALPVVQRNVSCPLIAPFLSVVCVMLLLETKPNTSDARDSPRSRASYHRFDV